jgi:hypothetical protein
LLKRGQAERAVRISEISGFLALGAGTPATALAGVLAQDATIRLDRLAIGKTAQAAVATDRFGSSAV